MSAFMIGNKSICALAQLIVTSFNDVNKVRIQNNLYVQELEKDFEDCRDEEYTYDTEKIAKKLYDMNVKALHERYGRSADTMEMYGDFKWVSTENLWKKHKDAQHNHQENYTDMLIPLYKTLMCYLYQCEEGCVPDTSLYKNLKKFENYFAQHIVCETKTFKDAAWG